MSADENQEILKKIFDGIAQGNLDEVMTSIDFEVTKSTDKSTEWSLIETSGAESEKVYNQHMIVTYTNNVKRIIRFAETDTTKDFVKFVNENDNVLSVESVGNTDKKVYH